jgi:hypothetical protein
VGDDVASSGMAAPFFFLLDRCWTTKMALRQAFVMTQYPVHRTLPISVLVMTG